MKMEFIHKDLSLGYIVHGTHAWDHCADRHIDTYSRSENYERCENDKTCKFNLNNLNNKSQLITKTKTIKNIVDTHKHPQRDRGFCITDKSI